MTEFGDGTTVECFWGCGKNLTFATVQQDRIVAGGPYRRDNLVPSCADCNIKRAAASIPDGCHYGPVGELATDRHGRYPDEPPLASPERHSSGSDTGMTRTGATTTIPRPRSASAVPSSVGDRTAPTVSDEGRTAMHFPRPHRSVHRVTPLPDHQRQPSAVSAVALAEHTHDYRSVDAAGVEGEPDLVVIDTADVDELRARHPWLFTDRVNDGDRAEDRRLDRVDAELAAAEQALEDADNADTADAGRLIDDTVEDDSDDRDSGWGR